MGIDVRVHRDFDFDPVDISTPYDIPQMVASLITSGIDQIYVQIDVPLGSISKLNIHGKPFETGPFQMLFYAQDHFINPRGILINVSSHLADISPYNDHRNLQGWFIMNVRCFHAIRIDVARCKDIETLVKITGSGE